MTPPLCGDPTCESPACTQEAIDEWNARQRIEAAAVFQQWLREEYADE